MIEFTDGQKKMVATALTVVAFAVIAVFVGFLLWAGFRLLAFTAPAVVPVIMGFFLALFFKPYYLWWKRVVCNPTLALVVMLATVLVPLGILVWYAGAVMVDEVSNLVSQGPQLIAHVTDWFHATFPKLRALLDKFGVPYASLGDVYANYGGSAMKAGVGALKCLSGTITVVVTLIFFVYFLMTTRERRGGDIVAELPYLKDETRKFVADQIDSFFDILVSFFQRQTIICLLEGCLYGTGFWLVGLPYGFLIGFALGVINLIPFFGTVVCLPIALPLAYFGAGGSTTRLVMVLVVWGVGQLLDGYFITPKIQGNKTGLGYAGVIFSFFFWAIVLGPLLGMLLAIPLSAFCVVLWRAVKTKYLGK